MASLRPSERQQAKREATLENLRRQVKAGTLVCRRLTKAERQALDAAAERRRVHAPAMVDVEAGG
jgi:hypothetical protein